MRSQLAAQFMLFFRLIARILTFRDKKYRNLTFRNKTELYWPVLQQNNVDTCLRCEATLSGSLWPSLAHPGSLWLSLARCPAHSGSLWLSLALSGPLWLSLDLSGLLSGSLWLPLALSCSLRLSIDIRICLQSPRLAHKAIAKLAATLLRCMTLCWSAHVKQTNTTSKLTQHTNKCNNSVKQL